MDAVGCVCLTRILLSLDMWPANFHGAPNAAFHATTLVVYRISGTRYAVVRRVRPGAWRPLIQHDGLGHGRDVIAGMITVRAFGCRGQCIGAQPQTDI